MESIEHNLIGCILVDNELMEQCLLNGLQYTDFESNDCQLIYRAMVKLNKEGKKLEIVEISTLLDTHGKLKEIGGLDGLWEIAGGDFKISKFIEYLNSVIGKEFKHILYKDKIQKAVDELKETDPNKIIKRGWKEWDEILGGIYKGKIYTVGAPTGVGKTTFVNKIVKNVSMQGWKVIRYSLEDRMEDQGKEELFDEVNKIRAGDGLQPYWRTKFVNNEYNNKDFWDYISKAQKNLSKLNIIELDKSKAVKIDDLIDLMGKACDSGADMFVIDHLHYFEMDTDERHDLQIQNVMHRINEISRKRNVVIFLVAHYRNMTQDKPKTSDFKDGAGIKQVSNIIIQIEKEIENITKFYITKVRGRIVWDREFICEFDMNTGEYSFTKSDKQIELENNFKL